MRFLSDARALADMTARAARVADRDRPGVLLSVADGRVCASAGGSAFVRAVAEATVVEAGDVVVNGGWLQALAAAMPAGEVDVRTTPADLVLSGGGMRLRMRLSDGMETPPEPDLPDMTPVDGPAFARLCRMVCHATEQPKRNGGFGAFEYVHLRARDGVLHAMATNRVVCARASMDAPGLPDGEWLASPVWLQGLRDVDRLGFTDRLAVAGDASGSVDAFPLADLSYPSRPSALWWDRSRAEWTASVPRAELLEAVRALRSVCFDREVHLVPLVFDESGGRLRVSYAGAGAGSDSAGSRLLDAPASPGLRVCLSASSVSSVLSAMDCDTVDMLIRSRSDEDRTVPPVEFAPEGGEPEQLEAPMAG